MRTHLRPPIYLCKNTTILPVKSDSNIMFCLLLLSKLSTSTLHLS